MTRINTQIPAVCHPYHAGERHAQAVVLAESIKGTRWPDATTPRTDRPVTLLRTGPTPASRWGLCRAIRAKQGGAN